MRPVSREVVDEFAQAAQYWGWQQDCGTGSSVDAALEQYEDARAALIKRIEYLENRGRTLSTKLKRATEQVDYLKTELEFQTGGFRG